MKRFILFNLLIATCLLQACVSNDASEDDGIRAVKEQKSASDVLQSGTELRQFESPQTPKIKSATPK